MSDEKRSVRVTIFGEEYAIRSEKGEEYTRACAKHVDDLVRDAHLRTRVPEPHKAAVLAAMQITDELFRSRTAQQAQERLVAERLAGLRARVDAALGGPSNGTEEVEQGTLTPEG